MKDCNQQITEEITYYFIVYWRDFGENSTGASGEFEQVIYQTDSSKHSIEQCKWFCEQSHSQTIVNCMYEQFRLYKSHSKKFSKKSERVPTSLAIDLDFFKKNYPSVSE